MLNSQDSKRNLLEHSKAKVSLLQTYLVNYLSVLTNDQYTDRIKIYDFFCGRGVYDNNGEGSPIAIMRTVKSAYFGRLAQGKRAPGIDCYFSDAEPEHVQSVKSAIDILKLHYSEIGAFKCIPATYQDRVKSLISEKARFREKSFVFIDPYGYKDIKSSEIKDLLNRKSEVLLFLPIQFMYRFETEGPIKEFIGGMMNFDDWEPTRSAGRFVEELRDTFRRYMGDHIYVSTFLIEKDPSTLFSLFFFTTHSLGHEKMIDAKWKLDSDAGQGWSYRKIPGQAALMPDLETFYLEDELLEFLKEGGKDNCDVYEFVVINREYRSTHATQVCKKFIAEEKLKVSSTSTAPIRPNAFYINHKNFKDNIKKVRFEVI